MHTPHKKCSFIISAFWSNVIMCHSVVSKFQSQTPYPSIHVYRWEKQQTQEAQHLNTTIIICRNQCPGPKIASSFRRLWRKCPPWAWCAGSWCSYRGTVLLSPHGHCTPAPWSHTSCGCRETKQWHHHTQLPLVPNSTQCYYWSRL